MSNSKILKHGWWQVHLATTFSAIGLILTFFADPVVISLKTLNDTALLHNAFDRFYYWPLYRAVAQVLSFFFCAWSMAKGIITHSNSATSRVDYAREMYRDIIG